MFKRFRWCITCRCPSIPSSAALPILLQFRMFCSVLMVLAFSMLGVGLGLCRSFCVTSIGVCGPIDGVLFSSIVGRHGVGSGVLGWLGWFVCGWVCPCRWGRVVLLGLCFPSFLLGGKF